MAIKAVKPTSPGRRGMTFLDNSHLTKKKPEKKLTVALKSKAGRNCHGRITVRHRGGGAKRRLRLVDFDGRDKLGIPGKVEAVEYDPNRTANIALVCYVDGERRYVIAPQKLEVGDQVISDEKAAITPGNRMFLGNIPPGVTICNVEIAKGKGGQLGRSAGNACVLVSQDGIYTQVRMPSGKTRYISKDCMATIGTIGNEDWSLVNIGKAGRKRHMGWRPTVRGSVMNPCDHPHGGGEGRTSIGLKAPKTPWGKKALGVKTRKRKYSDRWLIK